MKSSKWDVAALYLCAAMTLYWTAWAIFYFSTGDTEKAFDQSLLASAWLVITLSQGAHRNNKKTIELQKEIIQSLKKRLGRDGL